MKDPELENRLLTLEHGLEWATGGITICLLLIGVLCIKVFYL